MKVASMWIIFIGMVVSVCWSPQAAGGSIDAGEIEPDEIVNGHVNSPLGPDPMKGAVHSFETVEDRILFVFLEKTDTGPYPISMNFMDSGYDLAEEIDTLDATVVKTETTAHYSFGDLPDDPRIIIWGRGDYRLEIHLEKIPGQQFNEEMNEQIGEGSLEGEIYDFTWKNETAAASDRYYFEMDAVHDVKIRLRKVDEGKGTIHLSCYFDTIDMERDVRETDVSEQGEENNILYPAGSVFGGDLLIEVNGTGRYEMTVSEVEGWEWLIAGFYGGVGCTICGSSLILSIAILMVFTIKKRKI